MHDLEAAQRRQAEAAARRVADATESRQEKIDELRAADERGRTRRVIGTADFVGVGYLEAGSAAAHAVGRVVINEGGQLAGYGTGSLVSSALLLTNHHVLPSADVAEGSTVEFSFEDGADGQPRTPVSLALDPGRFFLADEDLDFALVAVGAEAGDLAPFGFNRLVQSEPEAAVGEFVTIVQHPRGEKKQVALRENRVVDLPESFLHYAADTEPGSSGSPVFNDRWQVVSLHHASVPAPSHSELGGFVNEGIRVGAIRAFVTRRRLPADERALADEAFG